MLKYTVLGLAINPTALRKAKVANNFGLSGGNRVNPLLISQTLISQSALSKNIAQTNLLFLFTSGAVNTTLS